MPNYFIDFVNGSDTNAGTTPATAFKTIGKYTGLAVAGDIGFVRRNQTHSYTATITLTNNGNVVNPIVLMADNGTGWPGEVTLPIPVVNFGATASKIQINRNFWTIDGIAFTNSTIGVVSFENSTGGIYQNGRIFNNSWVGMYFWFSDAFVRNVTFINNGGRHISSDSGDFRLIDCVLEGGSPGTDYGFWGDGNIYMENVTFGKTSTHKVADILLNRGRIVGKNIELRSGTPVSIVGKYGTVAIEDFQGERLANRTYQYSGIIERNISPLRPGGSTTVSKAIPNTLCSRHCPLNLVGELGINLAPGSRTIALWMQGLNWTTLPSSNDLFVEVSYYNTTTARRTTIRSTAVLLANGVWTRFPISFTLNTESPVYIRAFLGRFESGTPARQIIIDPVPVVEI